MAARKSAKAKDEKTEGRCPNCGYCPHCGQSARPRPMPMPYPVPVTPYRWPRPYGEIWSGGGTSESTFKGSSINMQLPR